ncbi:hypothetical protein [Limoniibacter endophyticus]|uniref:Uncharacterized protein n=1 Tax=Limoniibacter endophyticus TaxID=1565040 RepID=A0A8J3DL64_9HYPH|nr:hypothetical protein [Limoniibacter endophyticus]GHC79371.1 hypothetical protein GCM10010136_31860 [Limoniibacter endophyticus]
MDIGGLKRDSKKVEAGEWVGDIPGMGDVRLRVRGMSSPTVSAIRSRKERKITRDEREPDGTLKQEASLRVLGETLYEAVLLDWNGFTEGGKLIAYDAELARKWLTDPDFGVVQDAVIYAARIVDNSRAADKEMVGNGSKKS